MPREACCARTLRLSCTTLPFRLALPPTVSSSRAGLRRNSLEFSMSSRSWPSGSHGERQSCACNDAIRVFNRLISDANSLAAVALIEARISTSARRDRGSSVIPFCHGPNLKGNNTRCGQDGDGQQDGPRSVLRHKLRLGNRKFLLQLLRPQCVFCGSLG